MKLILVRGVPIAIFVLTTIYAQNLKQWLLSYPHALLIFETVAKAILAIAPVLLFLFIFQENRNIISYLNSDTSLPPSVRKKYGGKNFNKLELYTVATLAFIACSLWVSGLAYYLYLNFN